MTRESITGIRSVLIKPVSPRTATDAKGGGNKSERTDSAERDSLNDKSSFHKGSILSGGRNSQRRSTILPKAGLDQDSDSYSSDHLLSSLRKASPMSPNLINKHPLLKAGPGYLRANKFGYKIVEKKSDL